MRISDWSSDVCSSDLFVTGHRMNKTQMGRVQCLAGEIPRSQYIRQRLSGASIDRVADERMADMRHMHAHLMRAAGFEPAFDQGGAVQRIDRPVMQIGRA